MRVKIGDTIYDSEKEPLMVILSNADKKNIGNMVSEASRYACFPDGFGDTQKMRGWMSGDWELSKGFSLWFDRESWGHIFDGLMLERERSIKRKAANPESNSELIADRCSELMSAIMCQCDLPVDLPVDRPTRTPDAVLPICDDPAVAHAVSRIFHSNPAEI